MARRIGEDNELSGSARPAAVDGQGGTGRAGATGLPDRPAPGPAWLPLIPAAVTLLAGLQEIQRPSFTQDEAATLVAAHRSFPQLVRMLSTVDVVHGAYYALIGLVVRAGGSGAFAVRLPSAVALAVAAAQRRPHGHGLDIRAADHVVAQNAKPGDALLNISVQSGPRKGSGERTLEAAYPYGLARLRDISAGASPQQSATLGGTYAPISEIRQRLAGVRRLWVVEWTTPKPVPILHGRGFTLVRSWDIEGLWLRLFIARGRP